ncbi:hypothetical protein GXW77_11925 [Roseomonas alkaliterrae]|uniref:hypothetical protein n=1 Tax=Neoroseomonas alkaliterrae TaxID=1452450 RepID=UPI001BAC3A98|nr:hypothetical protein [Neoroseomonas alkaliterrae]MBR0676885.1 hypothetical protein [Neoroseomonas alkaliterrae]
MSTRHAKCVQDAVAAGRISEATARAVNARVEELLAKGLDEASAMTRAAQDILAAAAEKKRQTAKRILAAARNVELAEAHPAGFRDGVLALLARDLTGKATYSNVEGRARAIRGLAHAGLADVLDRFRSKLLGLTRDEEGLTMMVRALYGEAPKDPAVKALADAWSRVTDELVDRFIAAGGHPSTKRADWRLPQLWDRAKVVAEGREGFLRFMEEEHAAGRLSVRDPDTGAEVNALRRAEIFSQAFERIRTEGLSDISPGAVQGRGALANQRSAMRAFQWTSAEAWLAANERFGPGNRSLYDMLNGHIDGMARDIAMLEVLGPNPEWMVRYLRDETMRRMAATPEKAKAAAWRIETVWAHVSGTAQTPVHEWAATAFREVRAFLSATRLGSALLSSVSDFATMRQVSAWNGLPATGWMRDYLRLLNPANAEDRRIAVRAGLIAEAWAQRAVGAMRNQADVVGTGLGSRLADFVLRASGLTAHTQSARWAIGMEMLGHLADQAGRGLDQLDPALRQAMGRYGIGAAEWDLLRAHGVQDLGGWRVISPEAVVRADAPAPPAPRPAPRAERWAGEGPDAPMRLDDGSSDIGNIPHGAAGIAPGPIRLRRGWHDPVTGKGEGLEHIAAQRQGQIAEPPEEFVLRIARSFSAIHEGRNGSLVLVAPDEGGARSRDILAVALSRSEDGGYNVITAGRFRDTWLKEKRLLWEAERRSGPGGEGAAPLQRGGQSDATYSTASARLEAATRLLEFVQSEARFAVPEPGAAERSLMLGQTRPGTLAGEFLRSALQFKSFPVTVMLMHVGRGLAQESAAGKAAYLASFAIGTTLMGALAMQLKAIAQGRDPRAMDDHRFWGAAFAQGGGAGILGDFLFTAVNRADQSFIANTLGGPMGGLADDIARIAGLNIQALDDERKERAIGADLARFVRNNTPGTTLWYSRLATDRLLWDRLQWWADPKAGQRFRQAERRALREYEQEFWWAPGEAGPRRAPAAAAAIGGR